MLGRKNSKVKSLKAEKKADAKRYAHTVSCAIKNYCGLIESEKSVRGKEFFQNQMEGFISAVKLTDDYKENRKKFDKIIAEAQKKNEPNPVKSPKKK